jgi:hypothetical protein
MTIHQAATSPAQADATFTRIVIESDDDVVRRAQI